MNDDNYPLIITRPMEMTDVKLVETNIPENDYPEFDLNGTYSKGGRCITVATHEVWQSIVDGNTGNPPAENPNAWARVGKTNRWRAFDDAINTQTMNDGSIQYQIRPFAAVTNISLLNVTNCLTVRVRMIDPFFGVVYDKTLMMNRPPETSSWWVWSFGGRRASTLATFSDLPAYLNADLHIDLDGGAALGVGVIMFGQQRSFGLGAQYGARVGMLSHSVRERDPFGALRLLRRLPSKTASFTLLLKNEEVDSLNDFLMEIDGVACFFSAARRFETLNVYGIVSDFDTLIAYPNHSLCDINLESLQ